MRKNQNEVNDLQVNIAFNFQMIDFKYKQISNDNNLNGEELESNVSS